MYVVVEWAKPTETMVFRKKRGLAGYLIQPGFILEASDDIEKRQCPEHSQGESARKNM